MEEELVTREGIEFEAIEGAAVVGVGLWRGGLGLARLAWGALQAMGIIRRFRPDALFVTGGYTAISVAIACRLMRIPIVVYLPDIEPGSAVRVVARFAATVAVTAEESRKYLANQRVVVTGYPVRPSIANAERTAAARHFGLRGDRPVVMVFGGSRGARSINMAVLGVLEELLDICELIHVSGSLDWQAVEEKRGHLPPGKQALYHAFPYLHDDMGLAMSAADLAVARAGASVLGELPMLGLGAILVPYPYAWRYQKVNADYLATRGAAVRLKDEELSMTLASTIRELLNDPQRMAAMKSAARALATPDAAQRIAAVLLSVARQTG